MNDFCLTVTEALRANNRLVAATLVSQDGSTPRTAGARMLVFPDGSSMGSIGGGAYEGASIAEALAMLRDQKLQAGQDDAPARILHFSLQGISDMDMVCGGRVIVLLELLHPGSLPMFEAAAEAEAKPSPFVFSLSLFFDLAAIFNKGSGPEHSASGRVARVLHLQPEGKSAEALALGQPRLRTEEIVVLDDPFPIRPRLYLFGAGHVAKSTAFLAETCGFGITVLDDRAEFVTQKRFAPARRVVLPNLGEESVRAWLNANPPSENSALLILTRGHSFDKEVLAACLDSGAGYIGMIGSQRKRDQIYGRLEREGHSKTAISKVRCPVGLPIGAETPEEIAVSIMAEIIAWRRTERQEPGRA